MRIEQLMIKFSKTCGAQFSLGEAARLILETAADAVYQNWRELEQLWYSAL